MVYNQFKTGAVPEWEPWRKWMSEQLAGKLKERNKLWSKAKAKGATNEVKEAFASSFASVRYGCVHLGACQLTLLVIEPCQ